MATSYTLIGNAPTIQVVSPTVSYAVEVATIQTIPSGVIASLPVMKEEFDAGTAGPQLTDFANAIETIISQGKAIGGTGTTNLDANGLEEYFVTFTVAYNPTGAPIGAVTTDVDVRIGLLNFTDGAIGAAAEAQVVALIDDAYNNLVSLSKG